MIFNRAAKCSYTVVTLTKLLRYGPARSKIIEYNEKYLDNGIQDLLLNNEILSDSSISQLFVRVIRYKVFVSDSVMYLFDGIKCKPCNGTELQIEADEFIKRVSKINSMIKVSGITYDGKELRKNLNIIIGKLTKNPSSTAFINGCCNGYLLNTINPLKVENTIVFRDKTLVVADGRLHKRESYMEDQSLFHADAYLNSKINFSLNHPLVKAILKSFHEIMDNEENELWFRCWLSSLFDRIPIQDIPCLTRPQGR